MLLVLSLLALAAAPKPPPDDLPKVVPPPRQDPLFPSERPEGVERDFRSVTQPPVIGNRVAFFNARFGVGTDAGDAIRADPSYALAMNFGGIARLDRLFATVDWGVQIAGPEPAPPNGESRQTFQAWELGADGGIHLQPSSRWHLLPMVGIRIQPDVIGPADTDAFAGAEANLAARYVLYRRAQTELSATVRVVGRYAPVNFDATSDRRLRRSTCFHWGEAFLDCALAFSLNPGALATEGRIDVERGPWSAAIWSGWLGAARADVVNAETIFPVPIQGDGDWTWIGVRVAYEFLHDTTASAAVLTGGRLRDSLGGARVPLFTSDLARTTVVLGITAYL